jgi:crotonobetainyl-CoA:carnitine CoA-transferase CaiB-like acyl-CoA transferase
MEEYDAAQDLRDEKYAKALFSDPSIPNPDRDRISAVVGDFVQTLPAEEVYRRGQNLRLTWGVVRRPEENLDDPHWTDREFWAEVEAYGHASPVRIPAAPYRFTYTPISVRRRAPLLGEHNFDVYGSDLGLALDELVVLAECGTI